MVKVYARASARTSAKTKTMATLFVASLCLTTFIPASPAAARGIGRVLSLRGTVTSVLTDGQTVAITRGQHLPIGVKIITGESSAVRLLMSDMSIMDLGSNTQLQFKKYTIQKKKRTRTVGVHVWAGQVWARVAKLWGGEKERNWKIMSDTAVAGVRGTEIFFDVDAETGDSEVTCLEGDVLVTSTDGQSQALGAMQQANVGSGTMETGNVTSAEAQSMVGSVASGGTLNSESASSRGEQAALTAPPAPEDDDDDLEDQQSDGLDLDPASVIARVKLRLKVRSRR